jgi:hypothetical protein
MESPFRKNEAAAGIFKNPFFRSRDYRIMLLLCNASSNAGLSLNALSACAYETQVLALRSISGHRSSSFSTVTS